MKKLIRALIVEDSEEDALLLIRQLRKGGYDLAFTRVWAHEPFCRALETATWDIIFCDFTMPGFSGPEALNLLRQTGRDIPFIYVSGTIGEDVAVEALKAGAHDYVMKGKFSRLVPALERALQEALLRRERIELEQEKETLIHDLGVHVKLIDVLHRTARLLHDQAHPIDYLLRSIASWLPEAFRHPEIVAVRIIYKGTTYASATGATRWNPAAEHSAGIEGFLSVAVCYIEPLPAGGGSRFLEEERALLTSIAEMLNSYFQRREAEAHVRQREEHFRALIENSADVIGLLDRSGTIRYESPSIQRVLGYTPDEIVGQDAFMFVHPEDLHDLRSTFERIVQTPGESVLWEFRCLHKNQQWRWLAATGKNLLQTPSVQAVVINYRDITERKHAEAQIRFQASLLDQVNSGAAATTLDGTITYWNHYAEALHGWAAADVLGKPILDYIVPEEERAQAETIISLALSCGSGSRELSLKKRDGTVFPAHVNFSLLRDNTGAPAGFVGISTDMSERRKTEDALTLFRTLIDQSSDAIEVIDPESGRFLDANEAAWKQLDYTREEFLVLSVFDIDSSCTPATFASLRARLEVGVDLIMESVHRRKNGEEFPVEINKKYIRLDRGYIVSVVRDITERRIAQKILHSKEEERKNLERQFFQAQKLESIGTLAGGIAHDFNNILGIILGYTSFLQRGSVPPAQLEESLNIIESTAQRGSNLVKQILTFARKSEIHYGYVEVHPMLKEIVKTLQETFPRTIAVVLRPAKDLPPIMIDVTQFHQAILNLCVNARDAMPKGGTLTISTGVTAGSLLRRRHDDAHEDSYLSITVTDSGLGMDPKIQSHIFEPFFTTKERGKGTGLGLAVVYGVAKNHRGFIDVESVVGEGSTFSLFFPVPNTPQESLSVSIGNQTAITGGTETLLFVEDEEALYQLLTPLLTSVGYSVLTARDGNQAVEVFRQHKREISLVLTDFGLPKMSGHDIFLKIREIHPDIKVIVMSGYLDPEMKSEMLTAGVRAFISKPFSLDGMLRKIREVLDGKERA